MKKNKKFLKAKEKFEKLIPELEERGIIPLEEYKGALTSIKWKCLICGHIWETIPTSIKSGSGCPKCAEENRSKRQFNEGKKRFEELIPELEEKGIIPLEEYKGIDKPIKFKCLKCGNIWEAPPSRIKFGGGCPKCFRKKQIKKGREKFEKLISELKEREIIPLEEYKKNNIPITFKCLKCGNIWETTPINIKAGSDCPICAKKNKSKRQIEKGKKRFENLIPELKEREIIPLEEYKGVNNPIKFKCLKCGNIWETRPAIIKSGSGCPICAKKRMIEKRSKKLFKRGKKRFEELIPKLEERGIIPLEEYKGIDKPIKFKCLKCGNIWKTIPASIKSGSGCPKCACSKGEDLLTKIFSESNIKYVSQFSFKDLKIQGILKFDFYLLDYNILIEFDGSQHFEEVKHWGGKEGLKKIQLSDRLKEEYCKQNNIPLIRISYKDFDKLENLLEIKNKEKINIINELFKLNYLD